MGTRLRVAWALVALVMWQAVAQFEALRPHDGWLSRAHNRDLERETTSALETGQPHYGQFRSPVAVGQQLRLSRLFASNGRLPASLRELNQMREQDLFQCVDHRQLPFEAFVRQYNRTFADDAEKLERWNLFYFTLKRAIMLNRIVQNEFLNATNYQVKPEIRNYHFIEPVSGPNAALWYADITDCELGLIKTILFELFHRVETNDLAYAYKLLEQNREFLPALFEDDGFEQLANILLVRLYDRFQGDELMNKLFEWPLYLKRLASYVYSQRQAGRPGFKAKVALVSFAYPAYFKDLKYNAGAINRTGDNLRANEEHKRFNAAHERKFDSLAERNKRLAIFRQRWTLLSHLNDEQHPPADSVRLVPDWQRLQYLEPSEPAPDESPRNNRSGKLLADGEADNFVGQSRQLKAYKLTQFSDLTDPEFVAFLSNDFSLLEGNTEAQNFLDRNFRLRPLDAHFRWELAAELELRRAGSTTAQLANLEGSPAEGAKAAARPSLRLAKQVIDELISDVGLPIGPATLEGVTEDEHYRLFERLGQAFQKPYMSTASTAAGLSSSELADERQRRYATFKQNHGRFLAWMVKESWQLDAAQQVAMMRLADMSWLELKLTAFKICCLNADNLAALSAQNATIQYLGSNGELLCSPLEPAKGRGLYAGQLQQQEPSSTNDLNALELYYYYSVHFNKHHLNGADFERRFEVFRRNFDAIRRHSCKRSLTLFESLRLRKPDLLSTIDVIDPRRSHTDDLNLDRFEYFRIPAGSFADPRADLVLPYRPAEGFEPSRAGVNYRREPFSSLLNRRPAHTSTSGQQPYLERIVGDSVDANEYARRYARNNVARVYDLVVARYKFCMKTIEGVDLEGREVRQQCQATGPLGDQAIQSGLPFESGSARLRAGSQGERANCKFYWQGLEPWAANLIPQDELSAQLIREAKCAT